MNRQKCNNDRSFRQFHGRLATAVSRFVTGLFVLLVLAILFSSISDAQSSPGLYHSYGTMVCSDCHQFFGSPAFAPSGDNPASLKTTDISDLCLGCHTEGNNTALTTSLPGVADGDWRAPIVMTLNGQLPADLDIAMPAGDFFWSRENPNKGHNPAFTDGQPTSLQMQPDQDLRFKPPGGTLVDGNWSCASCHGSHYRFDEKVSAWRQLKRVVNGVVVTGDVRRDGVEKTRSSLRQDVAFEPIKSNSRGIYSGLTYRALRADGRPLDGADLFQAEGDLNKNVYRGGISSFCTACHGEFHAADGRSSGRSSTSGSGGWLRHPANYRLGDSAKYGLRAYSAAIINVQGINPNPVGYDWKYPLVKADGDFSVSSHQASATDEATLAKDDRIMCLTCHKAHATQFENMTRWDARGHSFISAGDVDFSGEVSPGDNPAYGCGKCHQMGGQVAFVKRF